LTRGRPQLDRFTPQLTKEKEEKHDLGRKLEIQMHLNGQNFEFEL
jgi:hypothetical protein